MSGDCAHRQSFPTVRPPALSDPIAIIGGGLVGASLAYRLSRRGHAVLVVDDARPGRASGWNPGGINPLHGPGFPGEMEAVYRAAYELHRDQWPAVRDASGIDFGWRAIERLFLARDHADVAELERIAPFYAELEGFSARWLEPADMAGVDRRIPTHWAGGLMTFGNVRLDAERYRQALLAAADVCVVAGRVERVIAEGQHIRAIDWGDGPVAVAQLCLAIGAWADAPIAGWAPGPMVPVRAVIGDLLLVQSEAPPPADISFGLTAIYQHDGDRYWIGGTTRADGPVGPSDDATERLLLAGADSLLRGWQCTVIERGSAARPECADGRPIVGRAPAYANAWVANGLGGKGVLLSAWAADALAKMIEAGEELPEFARFSPNRQVQ